MEPDLTSELSTRSLRTPLPNNRVIFYTQIFVRPLIFLIRLALGRRITIDLTPDQIDPQYSYVIAPNHGSWFDPLVILYSFPLRTFMKLGPIRVMVLNKLFDSVLRPFIVPLGSFPAKPHKRYRYGLDLARSFLEEDVTIGIFPEGRRNLDGTVKPRRGVAELADGENVRLIPVHIEWRRHFFGLVPTYRIHIGAPRSVAGKTAEEIMREIYSLPTR